MWFNYKSLSHNNETINHLQRSVEKMLMLSVVAAKPGGKRPSEDPLTTPQSPEKASVLLLPFQETIWPSLEMSSLPVRITSLPSDQDVPLRYNIGSVLKAVSPPRIS